MQQSVYADLVLVVDDDQSTRDSLTSVLESAGMKVLSAGDPTEALTLQGLRHPAAVVVDHQLADHTGVDLAQRLKDEDPETSVLLLTGLATLDGVLAASEQLDALLVKPLVPQAFVQTVRTALAKRALAVQNQQLTEQLENLSSRPASSTMAVGETTTESPNRGLLEEQLDKALAAAQRDDSRLAVLFVELGGYQDVSDQFGPNVAERVVHEVTSRLSVARRKSDIVARVASDKVAVVCSDVHSSADAVRIAGLVADAVARPVAADGAEHWMKATVGIVLTDAGAAGESAAKLLENAELAMFSARDEGRGSRLFDESMRDRVVARYEIEQDLQHALDHNEFAIFYQPVVDLQSGKATGAEALLRWQRPGHGVVLPGEFLDQAAAVGLAEALSRWTLERALSELARWRETEELPESFRLTVNVSAHELTDTPFAETLEELAEKHGIAPTMLSVDLTAAAASAAAAWAESLGQLADQGVTFSLDDFGEGEAKLAWLQDLPISALKIAPRFVAALDSAGDPTGAAMVRAMIALGRELHVDAIAEGVETPAQAAALRAIGCPYGQGYHLGQPTPQEEFAAASSDGSPSKT